MCGAPYKRIHQHETVRVTRDEQGKPLAEPRIRTVSDYVWYAPNCHCEDTAEERARRRANIQARIDEIGIPAEFADATFDTWDHDNSDHACGRAMAVVRTWAEAEYQERGVVMHGSVGTGKTHTAASAAKALTERGLNVRFVVAADLIRDMIRKDRDVTDEFDDLDGVVIDDADKVAVTESQWIRERIFALFDRITRDGKVLILTSNVRSAGELRQKFGDAVTSRLIGGCRFVNFDGKDYRLIKRAMGGEA